MAIEILPPDRDPDPDPDPGSGSIRGRAQELLEILAGPGAVLRNDQWRAIEALVLERRRVFVVQATGWGKSAVYFVATALRRDQGAGPTLLVSPLLALMRDQIQNARRMGVRAETINSSNLDEWDDIEGRVLAGEVDLLCISPERLNAPGFRDVVLPALSGEVGLVTLDEAHCLSDWGHDFRPDFRRIRDLLARLGDIPVLACTATANNRVVADVTEQLGQDVLTLRGNLDRASLACSVAHFGPDERLAFLADALGRFEGSGIVYTLTVAESRNVAAFLGQQGHAVVAYSGETETAEREQVEADLKANRVKAVVATSALGMGFDKPDVAFTVHYGSPGSPVALYQQIGRAGRALEWAEAVVLPGPEDRRIWEFFDRVSLPPEIVVREVLDQLNAAQGDTVSLAALERGVNLGQTRLETLLKVLDVDGAVERVRGGYRSTGETWVYDEERLARLAEARRVEHRLMEEYLALTTCRLAFLRRVLDDPELGADEACGRCDNCRRVATPAVGADTLAAARTFLRGQETVLAVRKAWPRGLESPRGVIPAELRTEEGRALSVAGDGGWAAAVDAVLDDAAPVTDEIADAFAAMLGRWDWAYRPTWITFVPSRGRHQVVEELSGRLSRLGNIPIHAVLERSLDRPPQGQMRNSAHQLANVYGAFAVSPGTTVPAGPALLIDDVRGSGWTLTVTGSLLRRAGATAVLPAVLQLRH